MHQSPGPSRPNTALLCWFAYGVVCLWLALALSWRLLATFDYAYSFWYQVLDIEAHIEQYAAENVEKPGFGQLPPEQHHRAFAQIREAVHDGGRGLSQITYPGPDGESVTMLHSEEIAHLRDVADLFELGFRITVLMALAWLPLALAVAVLGRPLMAWRLAAAGAPLLTVLVWLLVAGPTEVFYTLHEWLFPPENPWFFYWEESLMSTLMKAPVLFGGIAAILAPAAILLTPLLYLAGLALAQPRGRGAGPQ